MARELIFHPLLLRLVVILDLINWLSEGICLLKALETDFLLPSTKPLLNLEAFSHHQSIGDFLASYKRGDVYEGL